MYRGSIWNWTHLRYIVSKSIIINMCNMCWTTECLWEIPQNICWKCRPPASRHNCTRFPKCLIVNVSDFIRNCLTEFSKCPRSILVHSVLKIAPQEEIWRCEVRWRERPQIFFEITWSPNTTRCPRYKFQLPRQRTNAGTGWVQYLTRQGCSGIRLANILPFPLDKEQKHVRPTFNCQNTNNC